ncbi:MAG: hypothetical protein IKX31_07885 [Muribaculaceae bacterium]|nr:hypothetical protein [Muribaculaceae bacterium]
MQKKGLNIKKWSVRALIAIGTILGLSSCGGRIFSTPKVYGPPPGTNNDSEVVEDVYGPPVEDKKDSDTTATENSILQQPLN